jgi:hypothetical protein
MLRGRGHLFESVGEHFMQMARPRTLFVVAPFAVSFEFGGVRKESSGALDQCRLDVEQLPFHLVRAITQISIADPSGDPARIVLAVGGRFSPRGPLGILVTRLGPRGLGGQGGIVRFRFLQRIICNSRDFTGR